MTTECEFCKKQCETGYCNIECFNLANRRNSYSELNALLLDCIGKKLIAFNITADGGKAILTFENKVVIIGAGGNLWDEAFPVFKEQKEGESYDY